MRVGFPSLVAPAEGQRPVKPMFRGLGIAASGLSAQRARMETIAQNLANAQVTRGPDGAPYQRRIVTMTAAAPERRAGGGIPPLPSLPSRVGDAAAMGIPMRSPVAGGRGIEPAGVVLTGVTTDASQGPLVYDPGHPDADANGYVRYPNVSTTDEIVDMMDAKDLYEANATVFQSIKQMLKKALDI